MLENLRKLINKLIAAYEQEREVRMRLEDELEKSRIENETYKKQIIELQRKLDNFGLSEAVKASTENAAIASKKVDALIKEIDKCIKLIQG